MTEESQTYFRARKSAEIISALSEMYDISLEDASDIFYRSETAEMIEDKVADLHCRSAKYLAQCVHDEYLESKAAEAQIVEA